MTHPRIRDLAKVVRSKNAKPFRLTFDILFEDRSTFEAVRDSGALSRAAIAELYGVPEADILSEHVFEPGLAFKYTMRRQRPQGAPGESDIYGAQQHAPLLDLVVPIHR